MPGLAIKLIVGLGNPGREYDSTRHNAGFWLADELARRHGGAWRMEGRFRVELTRARMGSSECWLAKPQAFMNLSGQVTAALLAFYKLDAGELLALHDELDLPPGELRLKMGGGAGGHNGLKDLIAHLGDGFWRLRIGVGHPGDRELVTPYLLGRASAEDRAPLQKAVQAAADVIPTLFDQGAERVMQQLHTRTVATTKGN
jgi:PTH1 family peptidyl-tRNA hydrolase